MTEPGQAPHVTQNPPLKDQLAPWKPVLALSCC